MKKETQATVLKSTGSWYEVMTAEGEMVACRTRGKLRLKQYRESNPVAVGDHVHIAYDASEGVIMDILPRTNHIIRKSVKKKGHVSVLAANVNLVLVLATLKEPRTSLGFIDRVLVTAEAFGIPQHIVFNKCDLLSDSERDKLNEIVDVYQSIGIPVTTVSVLHDDLHAIREILQQQITLVAGHSGTGKSTLYNKLTGTGHQTVGEISSFSGKGKHTTTFVEMLPIEKDTYLIDTPGIKEWGLPEMTDQEISDYFPEMRDLRLQCKFGSRCIHVHEPGCEIIRQLEAGALDLGRYERYLSILINEDNRR